MGFDINDFKKTFIEKVEKMVNGEKSEFNNGKVDPHERSIFTQELNKAIQNGEISEADAKAIFGLELSETKPAAARRASGGDGGDGGDGGNGDGGVGNGINIFVNNSVNINIAINISTEIQNNITNNLNCGCGGPGGADIDALVDILKQLLGEGGSIQEFILFIFNQFSEKLGLDLGNIQELLKQILSKLDSQEQTINKLNEYLVELMKQNYNALTMMGLKMDTLIEIVQKGDADNLEILGKIYTAIMELTGQFNDFTEMEKKQFNQIMEMLKNGNVNLEEVLALIRTLNITPGEGGSIDNSILQKILDAIQEGNKQILNALTKIDSDFSKYGDDIKAQLLEIINKIGLGGGNGGDVTVNVDLSQVLDMLKAILEKLDSIDKNTADTKELSEKMLASFAKLIEIGTTNNELQEKTNKLIEQLTTYIKSISFSGGGEGGTVVIDIQAIIDAINANGENIANKIDGLAKLIETLNSNVIQGNEDNKAMGEKILAAIAKLGVDLAGKVNEILEKLDPAKLDVLIDLLSKLDEHNTEQNKAILDAIAALGVEAGDILDAIKNLNIEVNVEGGGATDLSSVIAAINANGADLSAKLSDIFSLLKTLNGNVVQGNIDNSNFAQLILDAIVNVGNIISSQTGEPLSLDEIIAILKEILEAIKNHEVIITINSDGTINCEGGSVNEGENNDWNNVLNARSRAPQNNTNGIGSVTTSQADAQQGAKKVLLNGQYGGLKGTFLVKDNGDGTVDVFNLGGQLVRNNVPKE